MHFYRGQFTSKLNITSVCSLSKACYIRWKPSALILNTRSCSGVYSSLSPPYMLHALRGDRTPDVQLRLWLASIATIPLRMTHRYDSVPRWIEHQEKQMLHVRIRVCVIDVHRAHQDISLWNSRFRWNSSFQETKCSADRLGPFWQLKWSRLSWMHKWSKYKVCGEVCENTLGPYKYRSTLMLPSSA